jgi:hypothetical protein
MSKNAKILTGLGVVAGFLAVGVPNYTRAKRDTAHNSAIDHLRSTPSQNSCINVLRQLDGAKGQWAMENQKTANDVPSWSDLAPYCRPDLVHCPQGGTYTLGRVGGLDTCSVPEHARIWKEANAEAN